ncbi:MULTISPECIES: hypothetical protein [Rhodobacterales]|jgi:hypothetical protein|uniref:Uncharacterized protein n=1 Tax=Phaeobacter gallaeciensis TaxID=60890 RepID=A0A1B0ZUB1_9RHOB|nr:MULTISPECIES: hypothetical protein [Phaeobacter]ANP37751.1 hypothetical protein JL2886_02865 [Phaeobacter gallaeciensis]MDE4096894.1 hypothetical protein [Phaeobacter gallaeciensis]MDE4105812.1 hypothetical protein [Phaeobacter gallaeciensis]MDE4110161.1 hypothetical protein [Phaeobacter gallaeciensis]MDE4114629.1 hypothetical protein [Phaeobacter gallaeciensis]
MENTVAQTAKLIEDKAAAALKDLEQAWAYFTPAALPQPREEQPVAAYAPYYEAA